MSVLKNSGILVTVMCLLFAFSATSQAAIISTTETLSESNRTQLVKMLERKDIQAQMIAMGVDIGESLERVNQMTDQEVSQLNGQLDQLVVGAGVSTVELLLIILLIVLIV